MKTKNMKKINILAAIFICAISNAQVAIGKETFRSTGSILEFKDVVENGESMGIILPILSDSGNIEEGALFVDGQTKKVMYKSKNEKIDLTSSASIDYTLPKSDNQPEKGGVVIYDDSVAEPAENTAILKLESKKAALLLPHVRNVTTDIVNPEPGTIAYDQQSKSLAVFNGEYWFFWN